MSILNISSYKFISLPQAQLPRLQQNLKNKSQALDLKGTILLSPEGINQCIAGQPQAIGSFKEFLQEIPEFDDLWYKESWSKEQPFDRLVVKIKAEIISFNKENVTPESFTAPHISPETLKQWYDEERDMVVLDTRNNYEIRIGKFKNAIDVNLRHFRNFPLVAEEQLKDLKDKTIVTYCTGGIRCEKAAAWMLQAGFKEVYQLDGGILNYFEKCGGTHYEGECFVFDNRIAVDPNLVELNLPICKRCQNPLTNEERTAEKEICSPCVAKEQ